MRYLITRPETAQATTSGWSWAESARQDCVASYCISVAVHCEHSGRVVEPTAEPPRRGETSVSTINDGFGEPSRPFACRRSEPPHMVVFAGGMGAADDRRDLIRVNDYPTSDA